MSVAIRLSGIGKKGEKKFRISVMTKRSKNQGKVLEVLGSFDRKLHKLEIDKKRLSYWLSTGAIISSSLEKILA